jgi:hypothetical protein
MRARKRGFWIFASRVRVRLDGIGSNVVIARLPKKETENGIAGKEKSGRDEKESLAINQRKK